MWGDVFEILKRPRLLPGSGGRRLLMIGGLRSSFAVDAPCSTVLILRLDLERMEWDEAGRMPPEMYRLGLLSSCCVMFMWKVCLDLILSEFNSFHYPGNI